MQKNIGGVMGLYPTPVTVVGTVVDGRVNWLAVAHVGVVEHKHLLISIDKAHEFSMKGIEANKTVSVNLVNQGILVAADYCGIAKGATTDKSQVFAHHFDVVPNAPIIDAAPLSMACEIIDQVDVGNFTNYILKPVATYVQEEYLTEKGKVDYAKMSPVLFEFQTGTYLATGPVVGKCWTIGKEFKPSEG